MLFALSRKSEYRGFGDVTVTSDGAEILKRLPRAMPKPTTHIIDWFHIAMECPYSRSPIASYDSDQALFECFQPSAGTSEL